MLSKAQEQKFTVSIRTGYQQEDFSWSIAGPISGNKVTIFSELVWSDLGGLHNGIDAQWKVWKRFVLQTDISRTFIISGTVTDADYAGDNRTSRTYFALFNSDEGKVSYAELSCGYRFFQKSIFSLMPYAGYTQNRQSLYLLERDGHPGGLRSTYKTSWKGVVLGLHSNLKISESISIQPHSRYFQLSYRSEANWNLVEEFAHPVSFEHLAKGFCLEIDIKFRYTFSQRWSLFLEGTYAHWDTGKGVDKLYRKDGQTSYTQLNGIKRYGDGIRIGSSASF